jgi:PAS domain-containing protein
VRPPEKLAARPAGLARARAVDFDQRFRVLVESVKDHAIVMLDPDGRVERWSPGAEVVTGYRAEELTGQHLNVLYTPEDVARGLPDGLLRGAYSCWV